LTISSTEKDVEIAGSEENRIEYYNHRPFQYRKAQNTRSYIISNIISNIDTVSIPLGSDSIDINMKLNFNTMFIE
jgi:hypothetical protein